MLLFCLGFQGYAHGQVATETILLNFSIIVTAYGRSVDGINPVGLTLGSNGNYYQGR